jgi:hypothetical protein
MARRSLLHACRRAAVADSEGARYGGSALILALMNAW